MASSSSYDHNKSYLYDVFLSFSGEDTRKTFVDHLYTALDQHCISTFKDDEELEKGKRIKDDLLQSIEDSRFYIIVFSKNYASSSWCLNELVKIMECHKTNEHKAFPVFYDVDPSEVRKQSGLVGEALAKHKNESESEIGKWRKALQEAANLSGWDVKNTADGHEAKVIKLIVQKISLELRPINMDYDENLVGIEERMENLNFCLGIGSNDVRMIGIKGMGGAGKTTLARAIFDKISINFEGASFVENVRESASNSGLKKLQKKILKDVFKGKEITVSDVHEGKKLMKKKLCGKKVLVVLDDVDHKEQLEMLAGDSSWFKTGSRIIITTREGQVLDAHRVRWIHDVNLLSKEEAMCLLSRHAFAKNIPPQEFERLSLEVVRYASGLPLTIKVLGSDLYGKDASQWKRVLERLKTIPLNETLKKLEISYDNLENDLKEMFLDVACFLNGRRKDDAITMLETCRSCDAKYGFEVLEKKSLVTSKIWYEQEMIGMHDHLVEMGRNIVRREHPDEPYTHSRLWVFEEIQHVLANDLVNEATRYIDLLITPDIVWEGFRNMKRLRCLIVNRMNIEEGIARIKIAELRYLPDSLRYIEWPNYPHQSLPSTFEADNLVGLKMRHSKIKHLWEGGKVLKKLKFLDLGFSKLLTSLDLGLMPNLETLDLEYCESLKKLYVHGGCLKSLVHLNLVHCESLESYLFIEQLESLEVLHIDRLNLRESPDYIITRHSNNTLLELHLSGSYIKDIPASIGNFHKLVSLVLNDCFKLKSLPNSICSLQHLRTLCLISVYIEELPEDLGQLECLEKLELSFADVKHLPRSIRMLTRLKTLSLRYCNFIEKLPEDVGQLESLVELNLQGCKILIDIPDSICKLKCLKKLNLEGCRKLDKLPDNLGELHCLQLLDIQRTCITHISHSIYLLKGLKIHESELKVEIFDHGFRHLKTLDLGRCGIKELPDALERLECLEELNLSYTHIKHLPDTICTLKHVTKLFLNYCALEEVPEAIGHMECLEELNLSYTHIKHLPDTICKLKHLKKLFLNGCALEEVPEALGHMECLEELHLSYTHIKRLPDSICILKHLKTLVLQGCILVEKLPLDLDQLESLKVLDLSRCCSITEIPNSICMLKQLKTLVLSRCFCLKKLPDDVGKLESLEELYLSRCYKLIEIPSSIYMLKKLKILEICYFCCLEMLPDDVRQLESLEELHLSWCCNIREIPNDICVLKQLKILNLSHCFGLEMLPHDVGQLESLEELNLSWCCNIREIPNNICVLTRLKKLYLASCRRLEKLPDELGDLKCLEELTIWDTAISYLPHSISLLNGLKIFTQDPAEPTHKEPSEDEMSIEDSDSNS